MKVLCKHRVFELFWSRPLEGYCLCLKLFNTNAIPILRYIRNPLGSITYLRNPKGVLHSLNKTVKERNTLVKVSYKHHGLNYFGPNY
jgi:hypothetical protein